MNFKRLETFLWVATLGSFHKAAKRLHTTQPAISTRIAALEEELNVKLFDRDRGGIVLTTKGQELLPYAEKIVFLSGQLRKKADESVSLSGLLRLGVSETIVHTWLPQFLRRLYEQLPNLDVELTVDVTANLRKELLDRSIDLAFLMGPVSEYSIVNHDLCVFPLVWAASPKLSVPCRRVALEELIKWPVLTYARNTKPYSEISMKLRELETPPARIFSSSSLAASIRMTLDGYGLGTLPRDVIKKELKEQKLIELDASWVPSDLRFTASHPSVPHNPIVERATEIAIEAAEV
ncbi:MAG: LysR family transcriptional regulator [Candidatus Sedimenticola sp. 6PFRAG7]